MSEYRYLFENGPVKFDPEKEILVLKSKAIVKDEMLRDIYNGILKQSESGVVMIPVFMDFAIISKDTVKKESEKNDKT